MFKLKIQKIAIHKSKIEITGESNLCLRVILYSEGESQRKENVFLKSQWYEYEKVSHSVPLGLSPQKLNNLRFNIDLETSRSNWLVNCSAWMCRRFPRY